jgi:hypothetical protein
MKADFVPTESDVHLSSLRDLSPRRRGAGTQYAAALLGVLGRPVKPGDDICELAMQRTGPTSVQHHHLGADRHPVVEVDHIFVGHAEASR